MTAPAPTSDPAPHPRVLLAEDDPRLAGAYARRLEASGLLVDLVESVADARDHERRHTYACLVLDRLLPDGDVLDLVREIDERLSHPPIVLVSAVADEEDRVAGLHAGADDYVAKPVHLDELAVRVTRLVGAVAAADPNGPCLLEMGPVTLDPARLRVRIGDEPLVLPVPQLLILRTLLVHADRAVPADELLAACDTCEEGTIPATSLPSHVAALDRALDGHLAIERAPRRTYRIGPGPGPAALSLPRRLIQRAARRPRPS